jgi:hypothetical protein
MLLVDAGLCARVSECLCDYQQMTIQTMSNCLSFKFRADKNDGYLYTYIEIYVLLRVCGMSTCLAADADPLPLGRNFSYELMII